MVRQAHHEREGSRPKSPSTDGRTVTEPVLELDGVWKRYLLGQGGGALGILKQLAGRGAARGAHWSLQDVSLQLQPGESLGIVGHNGAGKTTLLKVLAGITRATRGRARTRGRLASLINVGAGFHPELSGRENVFLNGVILGLTRREVAQRYDEIVRFAGLERFMETPVKRYSAGMYARLAFSVAAHVDPDLLLVDEVLSVGDAEFQDRSLRRMLQFRDSGAGIVFVSHNLAAIELMCDRVLWLNRGKVRALGPASDVVRQYLDAVDDEGEESGAHLSINRCVVIGPAGGEVSTIQPGQSFDVRLEGTAHHQLTEPVFVVTIRGDHGPLFAGNMHIDGNWPQSVPQGPFSVECRFENPQLRPGTYRVEIKVKQNVRTNYFEPRVLAVFNVAGADQLSGGLVTATWAQR
jgi:ABC-type polysaccharide/polyol phosphate transport system ATPase subunit